MSVNISLPASTERYLRNKATSTDTPLEEVVVDFIEQAIAFEKHKALVASIAEADAQFERGEYEEWSPELKQRLIANGFARAAAGEIPKDADEWK